jgi:hypothetical protein
MNLQNTIAERQFQKNFKKDLDNLDDATLAELKDAKTVNKDGTNDYTRITNFVKT